LVLRLQRTDLQPVRLPDGLAQTLPVPPAPNSASGTSKGLKITVNKNDDEPGRFALSLYPKSGPLTGDYVLKFDAFLNHAAFADSGVGTTEYLTFGLNHSGDLVNWGVLWVPSSARILPPTRWVGPAVTASGTGFVGDDGAARGFQAWEGRSGQPSRYLDGDEGGIPDRDGNGNPDDDGGEPYCDRVRPRGSSRRVSWASAGSRWK
jgi:hypothetical protein